MNTHDWSARPFIFSLLGALSALLYLLVNDIRPPDSNFNLRVAFAAAITTFSAVFCVTSHRNTQLKCLLYAVGLALVVGGICYWRLYIQWPEPLSFVALALTVFVFTPFFPVFSANHF